MTLKRLKEDTHLTLNKRGLIDFLFDDTLTTGNLKEFEPPLSNKTETKTQSEAEVQHAVKCKSLQQ